MAFTFQTLGLPEDYLLKLRAQLEADTTPITKVTPIKKKTKMEEEAEGVMSKMTGEQKMAALFPQVAEAESRMSGQELEARKIDSMLRGQEMEAEMAQMKMDAFLREMEMTEAKAQETAMAKAEYDAEMDTVSRMIETEGVTPKNVKKIMAAGIRTGSKDLLGLVERFAGQGGEQITPNQHFGSLLAKQAAGEVLNPVQDMQLKRWEASKLATIEDKVEFAKRKEEMELTAKKSYYDSMKLQGVNESDALVRSGLAQVGSPAIEGAASKEQQKGKLEARYEFYKQLIAEGFEDSVARQMAGMSGQVDFLSTLGIGTRPITQPLVTPKAVTPGTSAGAESFRKFMEGK